MELANMVETLRNHILRNVHTRWISMLSSTKKTFEEYKPLLLKMYIDQHNNAQEKANLRLLCDMQLLLRLACKMPMMQSLNNLIKFS